MTSEVFRALEVPRAMATRVGESVHRATSLGASRRLEVKLELGGGRGGSYPPFGLVAVGQSGMWGR